MWSGHSPGRAYLLLRCLQRRAHRFARVQVRCGGGCLPEIVLRRVRARHGIARFVGVTCSREDHHHSGQRQRPSLLNEAPHPCGSSGQWAEGQSRALPAGTRRAMVLHAGQSSAPGARDNNDNNSNNTVAAPATTITASVRQGAGLQGPEHAAEVWQDAFKIKPRLFD